MVRTRWTFLIVTVFLIGSSCPQAVFAEDDEFQPGFEGTEPVDSNPADDASNLSKGRYSPGSNEKEDITQVDPSIRHLFDNSETYTPPEFLPLEDVEIEASENDEETAEDLATVSITPSGQVETTPADDEVVQAFKAVLSERDAYEDETDMSEDEMMDDETESGGTLQAVIGQDDRKKVGYPTIPNNRTIGVLGNHCTGTLIGPHHVLTAGHCVYNTDTDKFYPNVSFSPAQDGNSKPYGTIGWKKILITSGYTRDHSRNYDYAVVVLNTAIGNRIGYKSFGIDRDVLPGYTYEIKGYPGDKRPWPSMWRATGNIKSFGTYIIEHYIDTVGGVSGSAIIRFPTPPNSRTVTPQTIIGIHTHSYTFLNYNGGTRINLAVFNQLKSWIATEN